MNNSKVFLLGGFLILLMTSTVWAGQYVASFGAITAPDYEGSDNDTFIPALSLRGNFENGRYFSLGTNFRFNFIPSKKINFGPLLNYRQARGKVDNDQVDALKNIDAAFEAGAFGAFNLKNVTLGLEVLTDVSDQHEGTLIKATAGYHWRAMDNLRISPTVHITYADNDYMDTYFSIHSGNRGSSTLPNFKADGGFKDVGINIVAHCNTLWPQWGIVGIFGYNALLNDAKASPIVRDAGDNNQMVFGLMATYRWKM